MSYKDFMVVLDAEATARERIDFASTLAEQFSAHLIGLYTLPTPEAPRHFGYYDPTLLDPFSGNFGKGRAVRPSTCAKPSTMRPVFTGCPPSGAKSLKVPTPMLRCTPAMPIWPSSASSTPSVQKRV